MLTDKGRIFGLTLAIAAVATLSFFAFTGMVIYEKHATITVDIPSSVAMGVPFNVSVFVDINESNVPTAISIIEHIPEGWTFVEAWPNYSIKHDDYTYEWIFSDGKNNSYNVTDTVVNYTVIATSGPTGSFKTELLGWYFKVFNTTESPS